MEFVECEGETPSCGTSLCPEGVPCFNITDFDSNNTFPDHAVAIVTIANADDATATDGNMNEGLTFADNSKGNLRKLVFLLHIFIIVVMEVPSPLFMVQYQISNVSTYTELTQVYIHTFIPLYYVCIKIV